MQGRRRGHAVLGRGLLVLAALCAWWAVIGGSARAAECPNEAIRNQQGTTRLPECRAYEVTTPLVKETDIVPGGATGEGVAAESGDRILFGTVGHLPGSTAGVDKGYLATRDASGWTILPLTPPSVKGNLLIESQATSTDLSTVLATGTPQAFGNIFPEEQKLLLGPPNGPYKLLGAFSLISGSEGLAVGGSADLGTVAFQARPSAAVEPPATGSLAGWNLYQYIDGHNQLVGVDDSGSLISTCGSVLGNGNGIDGGAIGVNAMSADGSTLFFSSPDPSPLFPDPSCTPNSQLYARVDGSHTVDVSAPEVGVVDPNGPQRVYFTGAAADGSKVFFVTSEQLTADDTTSDAELYEYDLGDETLTRISGGPDTTADGNVHWAISSDDGSVVYFTARAQLIPGLGVAGSDNLYRYDTNSDEYSFVATLSEWDIQHANPVTQNSYSGTSITSQWLPSPDGRYLLFQSRLDLAGPDPSVDLDRGELYRYRAQDGTITCVSCPSGGAAPSGEEPGNRIALFAHGLMGVGRYRRAMTPDGSRIFFDTPEQLLPEDTNAARDVYEWDEGRLSLLTSGTGRLDDWFIDAGADARDVFIATHSRLVEADEDELTDIYDVRVDGGFPSSSKPLAPCAGDACQGPIASPPGNLNPGSAGVSAPPGGQAKPVKQPKPKPKTRSCRKPAKKSRRHSADRGSARPDTGKKHKAPICPRRHRRAGK